MHVSFDPKLIRNDGSLFKTITKYNAAPDILI